MNLAGTRVVRSARETGPRDCQPDVEDAFRFAWIQFFPYRPFARAQSWKGGGADFVGEPADPRDWSQERTGLLEAMDELRDLPESMQRVVLVRHRSLEEAAFSWNHPARAV